MSSSLALISIISLSKMIDAISLVSYKTGLIFYKSTYTLVLLNSSLRSSKKFLVLE